MDGLSELPIGLMGALTLPVTDPEEKQKQFSDLLRQALLTEFPQSYSCSYELGYVSGPIYTCMTCVMANVAALPQEERDQYHYLLSVAGAESEEHNLLAGAMDDENAPNHNTPAPFKTNHIEKLLNIMPLMGLCIGCAQECHKGHSLHYVGIVSHFRCDCGNLKTPSAEMLNTHSTGVLAFMLSSQEVPQFLLEDSADLAVLLRDETLRPKLAVPGAAGAKERKKGSKSQLDLNSTSTTQPSTIMTTTNTPSSTKSPKPPKNQSLADFSAHLKSHNIMIDTDDDDDDEADEDDEEVELTELEAAANEEVFVQKNIENSYPQYSQRYNYLRTFLLELQNRQLNQRELMMGVEEKNLTVLKDLQVTATPFGLSYFPFKGMFSKIKEKLEEHGIINHTFFNAQPFKTLTERDDDFYGCTATNIDLSSSFERVMQNSRTLLQNPWLFDDGTVSSTGSFSNRPSPFLLFPEFDDLFATIFGDKPPHFEPIPQQITRSPNFHDCSACRLYPNKKIFNLENHYNMSFLFTQFNAAPFRFKKWSLYKTYLENMIHEKSLSTREAVLLSFGYQLSQAPPPQYPTMERVQLNYEGTAACSYDPAQFTSKYPKPIQGALKLGPVHPAHTFNTYGSSLLSSRILRFFEEVVTDCVVRLIESRDVVDIEKITIFDIISNYVYVEYISNIQHALRQDQFSVDRQPYIKLDLNEEQCQELLTFSSQFEDLDRTKLKYNADFSSLDRATFFPNPAIPAPKIAPELEVYDKWLPHTNYGLSAIFKWYVAQIKGDQHQPHGVSSASSSALISSDQNGTQIVDENHQQEEIEHDILCTEIPFYHDMEQSPFPPLTRKALQNTYYQGFCKKRGITPTLPTTSKKTTQLTSLPKRLNGSKSVPKGIDKVIKKNRNNEIVKADSPGTSKTPTTTTTTTKPTPISTPGSTTTPPPVERSEPTTSTTSTPSTSSSNNPLKAALNKKTLASLGADLSDPSSLQSLAKSLAAATVNNDLNHGTTPVFTSHLVPGSSTPIIKVNTPLLKGNSTPSLKSPLLPGLAGSHTPRKALDMISTLPPPIQLTSPAAAAAITTKPTTPASSLPQPSTSNQDPDTIVQLGKQIPRPLGAKTSRTSFPADQAIETSSCCMICHDFSYCTINTPLLTLRTSKPIKQFAEPYGVTPFDLNKAIAKKPDEVEFIEYPIHVHGMDQIIAMSRNDPILNDPHRLQGPGGHDTVMGDSKDTDLASKTVSFDSSPEKFISMVPTWQPPEAVICESCMMFLPELYQYSTTNAPIDLDFLSNSHFTATLHRYTPIADLIESDFFNTTVAPESVQPKDEKPIYMVSLPINQQCVQSSQLYTLPAPLVPIFSTTTNTDPINGSLKCIKPRLNWLNTFSMPWLTQDYWPEPGSRDGISVPAEQRFDRYQIMASLVNMKESMYTLSHNLHEYNYRHGLSPTYQYPDQAEIDRVIMMGMNESGDEKAGSMPTGSIATEKTTTTTTTTPLPLAKTNNSTVLSQVPSAAVLTQSHSAVGRNNKDPWQAPEPSTLTVGELNDIFKALNLDDYSSKRLYIESNILTLAQSRAGVNQHMPIYSPSKEVNDILFRNPVRVYSDYSFYQQRVVVDPIFTNPKQLELGNNYFTQLNGQKKHDIGGLKAAPTKSDTVAATSISPPKHYDFIQALQTKKINICQCAECVAVYDDPSSLMAYALLSTSTNTPMSNILHYLIALSEHLDPHAIQPRDLSMLPEMLPLLYDWVPDRLTNTLIQLYFMTSRQAAIESVPATQRAGLGLVPPYEATPPPPPTAPPQQQPRKTSQALLPRKFIRGGPAGGNMGTEHGGNDPSMQRMLESYDRASITTPQPHPIHSEISMADFESDQRAVVVVGPGKGGNHLDGEEDISSPTDFLASLFRRLLGPQSTEESGPTEATPTSRHILLEGTPYMAHLKDVSETLLPPHNKINNLLMFIIRRLHNLRRDILSTAAIAVRTKAKNGADSGAGGVRRIMPSGENGDNDANDSSSLGRSDGITPQQLKKIKFSTQQQHHSAELFATEQDFENILHAREELQDQLNEAKQSLLEQLGVDPDALMKLFRTAGLDDDHDDISIHGGELDDDDGDDEDDEVLLFPSSHTAAADNSTLLNMGLYEPNQTNASGLNSLPGVNIEEDEIDMGSDTNKAELEETKRRTTDLLAQFGLQILPITPVTTVHTTNSNPLETAVSKSDEDGAKKQQGGDNNDDEKAKEGQDETKKKAKDEKEKGKEKK